MKNILLIIVFVLPMLVFGQTNDKNYVKSTTYQIAVDAGQESGLPANQKIESITYYDGLGRPIQSIAKNAGGSGQDIFNFIEYDALGRTPRQYLPLAAPSAIGLNFMDTALLKSGINAFYDTEKYENTLNPYSETHFEPSPANRPIEQGAPGNSWALNGEPNDNHSVKIEYASNKGPILNGAHDGVIQFDVSLSGGTLNPQLVMKGYYPTGEILKKIVKDENWTLQTRFVQGDLLGYTKVIQDHTTEEYTNKEGQLLLKRTFNEDTPHDTYYVYDDFGNLTFVLPPELSTKIVEENPYTIDNTGFDTQSWSFSEFTNTAPNHNNPYPANLTLTIYGGELNLSLDLINNVQGDGYRMIDAVRSLNINEVVEDMYLGLISGTREENGFIISENVATVIIENQQLKVDRLNPNSLYVYTNFTADFSVIISDEPALPDFPDVSFTSAYLNDFGYQYKYDQRNRLVEKKIPGKGWEYIVYNKLDQPILTQDANQRAQTPKKEWLFTKYDAFGRVAYTGIKRANISRATFQSIADGADEGELFEERTTTPSVLAGTEVYYSSTSIPTYLDPALDEILTISYYDQYLPNAGITVPATNSFQVATTESPDVSVTAKGLPTISLVRVLDTDDWITTITGYDEKARPVYASVYNEYLNSSDITESLPDFAGNILESKRTHQKTGHDPIVVHDFFTYDHQNRLKTHVQQINSEPKQLIVDNTYDELGQLESKLVGGEIPVKGGLGNGLQKVDYQYNVRGWLTDINDVDHDAGDNDLFNFHINYDSKEGMTSTSSIKPLYNGNISQTIWKTANTDTQKRAYGYAYDALNRINAGFSRKGTGFNGIDRYSLFEVAYDQNGNIEKLKRNGNNASSTGYQLIDNLTYQYNGNQLRNVSDATSSSKGFYDGHVGSLSPDFLYDVNGNMVRDDNKGISNIQYNYLNLPTEVTIATNNDGQGNAQNGRITYVYDATGGKQAKIVRDDNQGVTTTTSYASGFIYEGSSQAPEKLQVFFHPEGYIEPVLNSIGGSTKEKSLSTSTITGFQYAFNYTDHLGNIRLTYSDTDGDGVIKPSAEIVSEKNYYPFGLLQKGYNDVVTSNVNPFANRIGYGGKEFGDELGLDWYDITARNYDAAIARWMNIDPLAEQMRRHSPYNYAFNNPVYFMDPDGMMPIEGKQKPKKDRPGTFFGRFFRSVRDIFIKRSNEAPNGVKSNGHSRGTGWKLPKRESKKEMEPEPEPETETEVNKKPIIPELPTNIDIPETDLPESELPQLGTLNERPPLPAVINLRVAFSTKSDRIIDATNLNNLVTILNNSPQTNILVLGNASINGPNNGENQNTPSTLNDQPSTIGGVMIARAAAVQSYLTSQGINGDRIKIGWGQIRFVGPSGIDTTIITQNRNANNN